MVVAVVVGGAFEEPAPGAAFAAGIGRFFLPSFEDARLRGQGLLPLLGIGEMGAEFIGILLQLDAVDLPDGVEDAMFDRRRSPGGPEVAGDAGSIESEAVEFDAHQESVLNS